MDAAIPTPTPDVNNLGCSAVLLILTNSSDATADFLVERLESHGVAYCRIDSDLALEQVKVDYRVGKPALRVNEHFYEVTQFSNVWYRRPEPLKFPDIVSESPEGNFVLAEWAEAIEGLLAHIPVERWVNHPSRNAAASHKLHQLTLASELGLKIPRTLVTQDKADLRAFVQDCGGRIIVKPIFCGLVARNNSVEDSLIYTTELSDADFVDLDDLSYCPTLFQELVPKASDVRITIMDGATYAVEIRLKDGRGDQICDVRRDNMTGAQYQRIQLPASVEVQLTSLMDIYGLRFGAIDMAIDSEDNWWFFEINPNGQWAWMDIAGNQDIASLFSRAFAHS